MTTKSNDPERLALLRKKKLDALLTGKPTKQFADPALMLKGK